MKIINASERLKETKGAKIVIAGESGVGKTSLLFTLPAEETLFMDLEAGAIALSEWGGDTIRPETWEEARNFACYFGGPNASLSPDMPYSQAHYDHLVKEWGDPASIHAKYKTLFVDSITVAGRLSFRWCKQQDEVLTDKTKKINMLAVYGLHGREMLDWLTQLQHVRDKNVVLVGILDENTDEFNQKIFKIQVEGSKVGNELPGIVDELITMRINRDETGNSWREFVCLTDNPEGFPAKDRSGKLNTVEEPHLGKLLAKLVAPKTKTTAEILKHDIPNAQILTNSKETT